MSHTSPSLDQAPLISTRFAWKVAAIVALLFALTAAISVVGRMFGQSIVLAGHSTDPTDYEIVIGNDVLMLPANMIRFENQRVSGIHRSVDIYLTWPGMNGYSEATRDLFNRTDSVNGLIFASIAQGTMSRDMSGRFEPIYRRLIEGTPVAGPEGLLSYRMKPGIGYTNELLYVAERSGENPYVVRCLVEAADAAHDFATRTGCQRDVAFGEDLIVTYRFSIDLLAQWKALDEDLMARLKSALVDPAAVPEPRQSMSRSIGFE